MSDPYDLECSGALRMQTLHYGDTKQKYGHLHIYYEQRKRKWMLHGHGPCLQSHYYELNPNTIKKVQCKEKEKKLLIHITGADSGNVMLHDCSGPLVQFNQLLTSIKEGYLSSGPPVSSRQKVGPQRPTKTSLHRSPVSTKKSPPQQLSPSPEQRTRKNSPQLTENKISPYHSDELTKSLTGPSSPVFQRNINKDKFLLKSHLKCEETLNSSLSKKKFYGKKVTQFETSTPESTHQLYGTFSKYSTVKKRPGILSNPSSQKQYKPSEVNYTWHLPSPITQTERKSLQGFSNLGNTCYMNAILQSLFGLETFAVDLSKLNNQLPKSVMPSYKTALYQALGLLLIAKKKINSSSDRLRHLLSMVKKAISSSARRFSGYQQHDAHELLGQLLDQLKEEVVKINKEFPSEDRRHHDEFNEECSPLQESYPNPTTLNFEFEVVHNIRCLDCGAVVCKEESFHDLSLDIPRFKDQQEVPSIQDALDLFFKKEDLEYICEHCHSQKAEVFHNFTKLPRVLVLHLKRYTFSSQAILQSKLGAEISIPTYLTLQSHCTQDTQPAYPPVNMGRQNIADQWNPQVQRSTGTDSPRRKLDFKKDLPKEVKCKFHKTNTSMNSDDISDEEERLVKEYKKENKENKSIGNLKEMDFTKLPIEKQMEWALEISRVEAERAERKKKNTREKEDAHFQSPSKLQGGSLTEEEEKTREMEFQNYKADQDFTESDLTEMTLDEQFRIAMERSLHESLSLTSDMENKQKTPTKHMSGVPALKERNCGPAQTQYKTPTKYQRGALTLKERNYKPAETFDLGFSVDDEILAIVPKKKRTVHAQGSVCDVTVLTSDTDDEAVDTCNHMKLPGYVVSQVDGQCDYIPDHSQSGELEAEKSPKSPNSGERDLDVNKSKSPSSSKKVIKNQPCIESFFPSSGKRRKRKSKSGNFSNCSSMRKVVPRVCQEEIDNSDVTMDIDIDLTNEKELDNDSCSETSVLLHSSKKQKVKVSHQQPEADTNCNVCMDDVANNNCDILCLGEDNEDGDSVVKMVNDEDTGEERDVDSNRKLNDVDELNKANTNYVAPDVLPELTESEEEQGSQRDTSDEEGFSRKRKRIPAMEEELEAVDQTQEEESTFLYINKKLRPSKSGQEEEPIAFPEVSAMAEFEDDKENRTPEMKSAATGLEDGDWMVEQQDTKSREEEDLRKAMKMSLQDQVPTSAQDEEEQIRKATELSLRDLNQQDGGWMEDMNQSWSDEKKLERTEEEKRLLSKNVQTGELPYSYKLMSVVSHLGRSSSAGHYISDVYDLKKKQWTSYDDSNVTMTSEMTVTQIRRRTGYIFFYISKDVMEELEESFKLNPSPKRNVPAHPPRPVSR